MAQTLKFGNGTWATKKDSTLAYNDEDGNFKPLPFTYTGAGKGTRVNKEGLIEVVENDRTRIDYLDSEDGVFLLEKAATNLITYSEDFTQWQKLNSTVTDNSIISPYGSQNADLINYNITSSNGYIRIAHTASSVITFYVKYKDIQWLMVYGSGLGAGKFIDIKNSVIGGNVGSGASAEITNEGNGWKRVVLKSSSSNITQTSIYAASSDGSYSTITLSGGVYLWGAQAEEGNVSSYIPTQGTIQTRVQETASGSGNSEVFNDSQGVLYINTAALSNDGTSRQISISNGGTTERVYFGFRANSNEFILSSRDSSYLIANVSDVTNFNKYVFQYKSGNFKAFVNGFNYTLTADGGLLPTGLNILNFDAGNGSQDFYGKTKEVAYYDEVLTDIELETLTSYRTWEEMVKELNLNIIHNE